MKSPRFKRQRSFTVDGEKITIVTSRMTQAANLLGWKVTINGTAFKVFSVLTLEEAEDHAFVKWVKQREI